MWNPSLFANCSAQLARGSDGCISCSIVTPANMEHEQYEQRSNRNHLRISGKQGLFNKCSVHQLRRWNFGGLSVGLSACVDCRWQLSLLERKRRFRSNWCHAIVTTDAYALQFPALSAQACPALPIHCDQTVFRIHDLDKLFVRHIAVMTE